MQNPLMAKMQNAEEDALEQQSAGEPSEEATVLPTDDDPMHVFCADDDVVSLKILKAVLVRWGYHVTTACDGLEAWDVLAQENSPRLAVLDWMMPGLAGPEIVAKVRQEKTGPYTYLILLTGRSDRNDIVAGMEAGADDYITKPFDQHELNVRIRAGKRILDLQKRLLEAQVKLQRQATHDALTDVLNRRAIMDRLEAELNRGGRLATSVAAILVDLDHFKNINDTYGHQVGDEVLRESARRMRSVLRNYDTVGRYGGEEFLIVLSNCFGVDAQHAAERMRGILAATSVQCAGVDVAVTASFGVSVTSASCALDPDTMVYAADMALYRAKDGGRNRVEMALGTEFHRP